MPLKLKKLPVLNRAYCSHLMCALRQISWHRVRVRVRVRVRLGLGLVRQISWHRVRARVRVRVRVRVSEAALLVSAEERLVRVEVRPPALHEAHPLVLG